MLDHHQGVAFVAQHVQGIEQHLVVACMQANRGFVQHITDALQIAAQLCGQANALCLAATEGGRATVQGQVAQTDLLQKLQAAANFRHQVARDVGFAATQLQGLGPGADVGHTQARQVCNADAGKFHGARGTVEARAVTAGAGGVQHFVHLGLGKGLLAPLVVIVAHRVVQQLALLFGELDACAHTVRAPAVLAVVGEQARVQFGEGGGADRACAQG